ncbi:MAG: GNAT family N-acetyltransferase, partial [Pedobacter sp.]
QKHDAAKKFAEELHKNPTLYERFMSIKQKLVLKSKTPNKKGLKSLFLLFTVLFK